MKNYVADRGEVFLWFFRSANKRVHRSKLTVQIEQVSKIQLFSNRAVGTMQVWAIHPHRPTILSCLYYDSSNCVNSILWFCILDLPEHHLLYVCDSFCLFFSFFWSFPPAPSGSRGKSRSVFYQGTFTLNLQDETLAGCRWSLTGLQTETSQQNGRPEWPNCTLNLTPPSTPSVFLFVFLFVTSLVAFF